MTRQRWRNRAAALVFLLVGAPAAGLGVLDSLTALDTEYRILGFAFTLAGANLLAASVCLTSPSLTPTWGRPSGLVASVAGVGVGTYLLLNQVGYDHPERLVLWALIVLASGAASRLLPPAASASPLILVWARAGRRQPLRRPYQLAASRSPGCSPPQACLPRSCGASSSSGTAMTTSPPPSALPSACQCAWRASMAPATWRWPPPT